MKEHGSLAGYNGPWEFFARLFATGKGEFYFCMNGKNGTGIFPRG